MEESFRVRVDRTFASLSSSSLSPSQPLSSSLWSLTDDEIPKKSWDRDSQIDAAQPLDLNDDDDDEGCPFPSGVDRLLSKLNIPNPNPDSRAQDLREELEDDLKELDDDDEIVVDDDDNDDDDDDNDDVGTGEDGDDELDVKNSIGKDCTLDFEEEEDEYDKVAVGREKAGDRLYMSDVTDYMPDIYSYGEIPATFKEASRDPRANHLAASVRLKEDAEAARSFNSLQVSEEIKTVSETPNNISENVKSILKRKEDQISSKSEKRVRFEPSCKNSDEAERDKNVLPEPSSEEITLHKNSSSQHRDSSMVPDYICNPSRYTHYTFGSSNDMNEESNRQAYMDFFNMLKKFKHSDPEEAPTDLSKPVIFNPKKKTDQGLMFGNSNETDLTKEIPMEEPIHSKSLPLSFASESLPEDEASEMELDEQVTVAAKTLKGGGGLRTGRQYRARQILESE